jgi:hypothetical protein
MDQNEVSPRVRITVGTALGIGGLAVTIAGLRNLLTAASPLQDGATPATLIGLCFLFCGVTIFLPPVVGFRQRLFQALAITCMALLFDWVAFVPGPRQFAAGSSATHAGGPVNSAFGRVAFGVAAVLGDLFAFYVWRLTVRLLMTGSELKKP